MRTISPTKRHFIAIQDSHSKTRRIAKWLLSAPRPTEEIKRQTLPPTQVGKTSRAVLGAGPSERRMSAQRPLPLRRADGFACQVKTGRIAEGGVFIAFDEPALDDQLARVDASSH
jgi:hypothetical protein